jgi:hypothetical protein
MPTWELAAFLVSSSGYKNCPNTIEAIKRLIDFTDYYLWKTKNISNRARGDNEKFRNSLEAELEYLCSQKLPPQD